MDLDHEGGGDHTRKRSWFSKVVKFFQPDKDGHGRRHKGEEEEKKYEQHDEQPQLKKKGVRFDEGTKDQRDVKEEHGMEFMESIANVQFDELQHDLSDNKKIPKELSERITNLLVDIKEKLPDIFERDLYGKGKGSKFSAEKDLMKVARNLKNEIDDEVENKNSMLKDEIISRSSDKTFIRHYKSPNLQIRINTQAFFDKNSQGRVGYMT